MEMPNVCYATTTDATCYNSTLDSIALNAGGTVTRVPGKWGELDLDKARKLKEKIDAEFEKREENKMTANIRLIEYFVLDRNEHLIENKSENAILKRGCHLITENDQSFIIGLNIPELLEAHNKVRTTVEYEEETYEGKTVNKKLKPAKIKDLTIMIREIK